MRSLLIVIGMFCAGTLNVRAQLTIPADSAGMKSGEGMGMALYAEMNGYPGPKHVLDLKEQIGLTKDQQKKIGEIAKPMRISAVGKGEEIIEAEQELNKLFGTGKINEKLLRTKLEAIGRMRGDLRFIHLQAHLKMKQILTPNQILEYYNLRGREVK
jgi:Spy/CpxP family protein refolding chaperone